MATDPGTTNLYLAIIATVSILEAVAIVAAVVTGFLAYRRVMRVADEIGPRVVPAVTRFNAILDDVKDVTTTIKDGAERIDDTTERVRANVRAKTSHVVGAVRGVRAALETLLADREPGTTA